MTQHQFVGGFVLLSTALTYCIVKYWPAPKRARVPLWGWVGLGIMVLAAWLLHRGVSCVGQFFTPLSWTGYILFIDGLVHALTGQSRLAAGRRDLLFLAFWSFALWLVFEAYNVRLRNWRYVGLPESALVRSVGYVWSFATIWPAIFQTADFLGAVGVGQKGWDRRIRFGRNELFCLGGIGLVLVTMPVLVPTSVGCYLFGAVWLGFIFLLDPINYHWGGRSLLRDMERGQPATLYSYALAGILCGILWEFWNYWATAKWVYTFPIGQSLKVFEMPLPGYLGFPAFALECFVMYEFLRTCRRQVSGIRCWAT